ncbi:MAG: T9SS type A sorting domain-containing protein [Bacteroidota bacterium]
MHTQCLYLKCFVTGVLLWTTLTSSGQSLERKVFSSAGDHQLIGLTSYSYTFGEPFVGTDLTNLPSLTMGFHQPMFMTVLAVEHFELYARWQEASAALQWTSNRFVAGSIFMIERSTDGITFSWIGELASASLNRNAYSFTDSAASQLNTSLLYRVTWIDQFGHSLGEEMVELRPYEDMREPLSWQLFPNPAREETNLRLRLPTALAVELIVYNSLGQAIKRVSISGIAGIQTHPLSLSDLSAGTYMIHLTTPYHTANTRLIRTH